MLPPKPNRISKVNNTLGILFSILNKNTIVQYDVTVSGRITSISIKKKGSMHRNIMGFNMGYRTATTQNPIFT